jgi:hypothetical protein
MPIQNVGTLLENIVIVEAALLLEVVVRDRRGTLEFLNAFAPPVLSPWVPHGQNAGFDDAVLNGLAHLSTGPTAHADLLRTNLARDRRQGPNAAMLVLGAWKEHRCRLWLNDVVEGRYGNAIPSLCDILRLGASTYETEVFGRKVCVSDIPYPESLANLVP